jgi:SAM-dependent methyltransferase
MLKRTRQLLGRVRHLVLRALDRVPDWRLGIDTAKGVRSDELEFDPSRGNWYSAVGWSDLDAALPPGTVRPWDVFVDFGCGKGRALYLAARYPFARVVGIELDSRLAQVARRNLMAVCDRVSCQNAEVIQGDVLQVPIPADMTVAFLFNPFDETVFRPFLDRLLDSLRQHPRPLRLIYLRPVHAALLLAAGFAEERRLWSRLPEADLVIYRYDPASRAIATLRSRPSSAVGALTARRSATGPGPT